MNLKAVWTIWYVFFWELRWTDKSDIVKRVVAGFQPIENDRTMLKCFLRTGHEILHLTKQNEHMDK